MTADAYPRDLVGYGADPPDPEWPGGARLAVQFVVNYEEGGELNVLHGDPHSEAFVTEEPALPLEGRRNLLVESQYEYGSRAGFWRLHRLFTGRGIPVTVFGVTTALARNPLAVEAMRAADWEIASHGYKWIDYSRLSEDEEREHVREAVRLHEEVTGSPPLGWYTGRVGERTRELVAAETELLYDADSFADDLPYWVRVNGGPHLVVPYTLDNNDVRYTTPYGFNTSSFTDYLCSAFDVLYTEGEHAPKMMSVGLHCRVAGRPGRAGFLARFLDHVQAHDDVWVTRRVDIARHWHATRAEPVS